MLAQFVKEDPPYALRRENFKIMKSFGSLVNAFFGKFAFVRWLFQSLSVYSYRPPLQILACVGEHSKMATRIRDHHL